VVLTLFLEIKPVISDSEHYCCYPSGQCISSFQSVFLLVVAFALVIFLDYILGTAQYLLFSVVMDFLVDAVLFLYCFAAVIVSCGVAVVAFNVVAVELFVSPGFQF
jgi:hypothetical protein